MSCSTLKGSVLNSVRGVIRSSRRRIRQIIQVDPVHQLDLPNSRVLRLGSDYGAWTVLPELISPGSIVYSFGVGQDVSFDLALIECFGVTVHAFDPTPRSSEWVRAQQLPPQFVFHAFGLGDFDGRVRLYPPKQSDHVSYSVVPTAVSAGPAASLPVFRLDTVARMLGHSSIDLLKMDIEGSEFAVIESLAQMEIGVAQLLVEFHHRLPGVGRQRTDRAVQQLRQCGFRLFNISDSGEEYSFLGAS